MCCCTFFFFFKQKTAYEMRISDWSSDVCSSDLGFVLTIGAAVDANVLINERIREEQRRGRGIVQSVETGYQEASRTIWDANITNLIAAVIMIIFGSGPIKGFAVVLTIGIATSVFTAVTVTRLMVSRWLRAKRPVELVI